MTGKKRPTEHSREFQGKILSTEIRNLSTWLGTSFGGRVKIIDATAP